jgi:EAL domain-containing protein (putative c-di-GMP-specific phosphodiesterase class I)/GGDEF domain-containing protein
VPTLLHVEPDAADAAIHASVLRDVWPDRFSIVRVGGADAARPILLAGGIDCVLLADADPAASLPWLMSAAPEVPVVVLTGEDDAELGLRTVQLGAQDHLVRGTDGFILGRAVLYAIERKRSELRRLAERDRRVEELSDLADHDGVTGLPVRRRLLEALDFALARDERYGTGGAVVVVRLSDEPSDDRALRAAAERLAGRVRGGDIVAQIDPRRFAVLLTVGGERAARSLSEGLLAALGEGGHRATAGFAVIGGGIPRSAESVLRQAEAARAAAPEVAPGAVGGFVPAEGPVRGHATWAERLRAALADGAFTLVAQPIARVGGEAIPRFEMLLRLRDGEEELLPDAFLPAAEREGLAVEIDTWVLESAAGLAAAHAEAGDPVRLEVNVSPASVADPGLAGRLAALLARAGADPAHLVIELPERSVTADTVRARELAEELRALGCGVALDDIGRGGSLAYLDHLVFDLLKIDVSLAGDVAHGHARRALVEALVSIAHASGAQAVAEGVADAAAAEVLRGLGVDFAQGHHFGSPAPLAGASAPA